MLTTAVLLAAAFPAVSSPAPDRVALTVYRAPYRQAGTTMNAGTLGGFALVTETRTIVLPPGDATIRFIGVADGIIPASAIVTGLPGGTIEKNRDARLISPAALVDGSLGRQVTVRRTSPATGKITEEQAVIVGVPTGGRGGVVMRTSQGIETWRCPGLPDKLLFKGMPDGLSAKPVLSVTTRSPRGGRVTVRLSYLASGFDWNASYVATLSDTGRTLDLFAWTTLANDNAQVFPRAQVQVVAGRLNQRRVNDLMARASLLRLRCYPNGTTTSDLPVITPYRWPERSQEIIVTGSRLMARSPLAITPAAPAAPPPPPPPPPPPEDLGDLKLYRVPELVTLSSKGQKQVALIAKPHVTFERVYRIALNPWTNDNLIPAAISLRAANEEKDGLGIPLPAGTTALYQVRDGTRLLLGLGTIKDTAKGERVRLSAGSSSQVIATQQAVAKERRVSVSNANSFTVPIEISLGFAGEKDYRTPSETLERIDGVQTWRVTIPANTTRTLSYTLPND